MRVREYLRQAGAPWHEAVDAAFSRFDLGQADGYRAFLRAHARALPGLEQALEQAGIAQLVPDWPARRRRQALLADLADLGLPPPPTAAPRLDAKPGLLWGLAYVLEGSRLGGRLLARRVTGAQANLPVRYLGHGQDQALWPDFLRQLEAHAHDLPQADLEQGVILGFRHFLNAAEPPAEQSAGCAELGEPHRIPA